jgi:sterol desaturase/sphingolipid hydroxylase (fatty acid hydroxylase superfamily)
MALFELTEELTLAAHGKHPGLEPGARRKDRPDTIPVFKNRILENWFAKAHWITPGLWFGPLVGYGLFRGVTNPHTGVLGGVGLFLLGVLLWTLAEYLLHRFLFHTLPFGPGQERNYLVHQYHHDFPDDRYRLVMVPLGSWPLAAIWATVYYFVFGAQNFWPIMGGTAAGYVAYDWIHYYTHHARPKGGIGKWLRRYHLQHHHDDDHSRYGVSSPLWDFVFRTYKPLKSAATPSQPTTT